jgi:hypothetical protein
MKVVIGSLTVILAIVLFVVESPAQARGEEMLNEVPIWPVPAEMTIEEYRDAHRRLGVGLVLMSVPLPGTLHFHAGESREGWMHVGAAVLGGASVVLGASMMDKKDNSWKKTNFEIVDITGVRGRVRRYEKIPIEEEGGVFTYRLRKLERKTKGGGAPFVVLGAGLVVGQLLHDWIDGIKTIERKRDAVRFKYGKSAGYKMSMRPAMDPENGGLGARFSLSF